MRDWRFNYRTKYHRFDGERRAAWIGVPETGVSLGD